MYTLKINSERDMRLICAALHATMPIGGGSDQFHLGNLIADASGIDITTDEHCALIGGLATIAYEEYVQAHDHVVFTRQEAAGMLPIAEQTLAQWQALPQNVVIASAVEFAQHIVDKIKKAVR